jgi:hypothetical protein
MTELDRVIAELREQSFARGFGGRLEDFDVTLCEDGRTVSVWAFASLDAPLTNSFEPKLFDATQIYAALNDAAVRPALH